jgi:PAS domain S-box-containing protein
MPEKIASTHSWFMERRQLFLIIASAFIILSAITFSLCYRHHTINTEQVLKEDRSTANLLSLLLDEHFKKIVSVMEAYSNGPLLLQAVRNKNAEKAMVHLINLKNNNPDVDILIISDRQGTLWVAYPERPELLGKNLAHRDWYKGVSKEWKPDITDLVLRIVREKDLAVTMSIPIFDETRQVIGILVNTQRTVGLSNIFKQMPLDPGRSITVTDRKGQIAYSSRYDVEKEIRPYPFYPGIKKAMTAKNKTFAVDDPDLGGRTRYISFAPLANIGWTVSVERDKRSILLSGSAYYVQVTAIAFLLFLTIILFLFYSRKQVTTQQILEELQTEKIIRVGDAKFRALIENMQVGIVAHAPDTSILLSNPMASEILGLTPDQMRGKKAIDPAWCFIREDGTKVPLAEYPVNRTLAEEMPITGLVLGVIRPDRQSPTWVECNARKIWSPTGELEYAIVSFFDITQRKRAEEALRKSEAQLLAILNATPFPIALVDLQDNNINFWSHSALTLFGHTAPTAAEWYQIAYPDPDYQSEVIDRWKPFLEIARESHQTVNTGEYRVTCSDGSARICELYVTFLTDKLMVTFNDITDRKRAAAALRQQTEELRASNEELELFTLAATSRELRMIELKQEINELCRRLNEPPRHETDPLETDDIPGAGPTPGMSGGGDV